MSTNYPSDLTDGQWQLICTLLPKAAKAGRPRIHRRWVINAILYLNRTAEPDVRRRILEIVYLNCQLVDGKLIYEIRKPFDVLAEALNSAKSRGN